MPTPKQQRTFDIEIVQQPVQARMCGFSPAAERRMLDPPLVLQLKILNTSKLFTINSAANEAGKPAKYKKEKLRILDNLSQQVLCIASLASEKEEDIGYLAKGENETPSSIMFGQTCCRGLLMDDYLQTGGDNKTIYFVFSDLAIRVPGIFTIKIRVVDLSNRQNVQVLCTVPFEVFSPKRFKGMMDTSPLTRHLIYNGVLFKRKLQSLLDTQENVGDDNGAA